MTNFKIYRMATWVLTLGFRVSMGICPAESLLGVRCAEFHRVKILPAP